MHVKIKPLEIMQGIIQVVFVKILRVYGTITILQMGIQPVARQRDFFHSKI